MSKMRTIWMVAGLELAVGMAAGLPAQVPETGGPGRKAETQSSAPTEPNSTKAAEKSLEQWIAELGSDSYRTRLQAEKYLRDQGQAAAPALRKAADEGKDNEVQWRSRRLLRQIERGDSQGLVERGRANLKPGTGAPTVVSPGGPADGMREQFDSLFQRFERDFGLDIPRAHFFQDDFFRDLQDQVKTGRGLSQGMSVRIGSDGAVHVEVKETNEKGEVENKVYDAPDLQSFHQQYPGVLQRNGLGLGLQNLPNLQPLRIGQQGRPLLQQGQNQPSDPVELEPGVDDQVPPDGKRLGIYVHATIPAELREHLDLEDGVGLMVESVQAGSLAEALGLQRGDIVTKLGDRTIGSVQDVRQALSRVEGGHAVEVSYLHKGVQKTASAKLPDAPAPAAQPGPKLEPRHGKRESSIR